VPLELYRSWGRASAAETVAEGGELSTIRVEEVIGHMSRQGKYRELIGKPEWDLGLGREMAELVGRVYRVFACDVFSWNAVHWCERGVRERGLEHTMRELMAAGRELAERGRGVGD
jgi:hypothetical protein